MEALSCYLHLKDRGQRQIAQRFTIASQLRKARNVMRSEGQTCHCRPVNYVIRCSTPPKTIYHGAKLCSHSNVARPSGEPEKSEHRDNITDVYQ